jgi:hypothetical protein
MGSTALDALGPILTTIEHISNFVKTALKL